MDETSAPGGAAIRVGLRVEMRKPHPCGSRLWVVYRIGADIGLRCQGCQRRVLLTRSEFNKQLKRVIDEVRLSSEDLT
ncbi:MAG: DUF951 domain-containing protein [Chloroflexi bacterium]|nr:DUF951 domain-containing protein [Chloroflexota bacterium]